MKIKELRSTLIKILSSLETPALDARILLSHFLSMDQVALIQNDSQQVDKEKEKEILSAAKRRLDGTPMAYITGTKEFYGCTFRVNESVLIPQPDTETLVDAALKLIKNKNAPRILDICTGSGCIITALKKQRPDSICFFSDISPDALSVAADNYERITGEKGNYKRGDLFEPWSLFKFDLISANPPYVTALWYESVSQEVKAEPECALLDSAPDGLGIIRRIIKDAPGYLNKEGFLILEADYRQHEEIRRLLEKDFKDIDTVKDLSGKERVTYGRL